MLIHPCVEDSINAFNMKTLPLLQKHGARIGDAASLGDSDAQEIVILYTMLYRRFEQATCAILDVKLFDYLQNKD